MHDNRLNLVKIDPWLEPSKRDIEERHDRYINRLQSIENDFGNLSKFAEAYKFYGINYDPKRKGFTYREWAPEAYALFLTGDFNEWDETSHPLVKDKYGVWEIFPQRTGI
jgi:1,4-alpha-glucan branching enzyme